MSMAGQNFSCGAEDCRYWHDEGSGCTLRMITMKDGRCREKEAPHRVCIHISGGLLQSVYSDLDATALRVELYDSDNAKMEDEWAEKFMESELSSIAKSLHHLY